MEHRWRDAIKTEFIRLQSNQTVEEARDSLVGRRGYALIMIGEQPMSLITAKSLADLPLNDNLSQHISKLPVLVMVYDNPNLSAASLVHYIQTIMLDHSNLIGVVIMDQAGSKVKGIITRRDIVRWIASGASESRTAANTSPAPAPEPIVSVISDLRLVSYVCPECAYCQYLLNPSPAISISCPNHPETKLIVRDIGYTASTRDEKIVEDISNLRLDTAVPEQVSLGRSFDLAVAIRQLSSPILNEENLPVVNSGEMQVSWPESAPSIQLRLQVKAPECVIHGEDSYTFRLFSKQNSPKFYFQLTPQQVGEISIIVTVYQQDDWLGSARIRTHVKEQVVGEVRIDVSSHHLEPSPDNEKESLQDRLATHEFNLRKLEEQKAKFGIEVPVKILNGIEYEQQEITAIKEQLEELEMKN